jgi:glycosyltransferase involved in cell wall biosynthesis
LADKLATLLNDAALSAQFGAAGQEAVHARYHAAAMAEKTLELYRRLTASPARPVSAATLR